MKKKKHETMTENYQETSSSSGQDKKDPTKTTKL